LPHLHLHSFPTRRSSDLTLAYQKGEILHINYSCSASSSSISIISSIESNAFKPWWNNSALTIYGATAAPKEVRIGDRATQDWHLDRKSTRLNSSHLGISY